MRNVTVAAIQPPNQRDGGTPIEQKAHNVRIAFRLMEDAARRDVDLICLPETFPTVGVTITPTSALGLAEEEGGKLSQRLCAFARQHRVNIVAPVLGRYGETLRNSAWMISREGEHIGRYFKVHLTNPEAEWGVVAGEEWPVFQLDFAKVGVMTCLDNSFPESARCLTLEGADIICWPHIESGWGEIEWDITLRSRAIDNATYIISACHGVPDDTAWEPGLMVGRSGVVGPDGTIVADGGRRAGVVSATIDLDYVLRKRDFGYAGEVVFKATMLRFRRPDTYTQLADAAIVSKKELVSTA